MLLAISRCQPKGAGAARQSEQSAQTQGMPSSAGHRPQTAMQPQGHPLGSAVMRRLVHQAFVGVRMSAKATKHGRSVNAQCSRHWQVDFPNNDWGSNHVPKSPTNPFSNRWFDLSRAEVGHAALLRARNFRNLLRE